MCTLFLITQQCEQDTDLQESREPKERSFDFINIFINKAKLMVFILTFHFTVPVPCLEKDASYDVTVTLQTGPRQSPE